MPRDDQDRRNEALVKETSGQFIPYGTDDFSTMVSFLPQATIVPSPSVTT